MRFLIVALVLTLAVAIAAATFAIWPVVTNAPWEESNAKVEVANKPASRLTRQAVISLVAAELCPSSPSHVDNFLDSWPRYNAESRTWTVRGQSSNPRYRDAAFRVFDDSGQVVAESPAARALTSRFAYCRGAP